MCRNENSCANSNEESPKQEKASTKFEQSLRHEKGGHHDPDTKSGKGNCGVGRNTKGHEEKTVPRIQHDVLGFRDARKTALGVQSNKQPVKTKIAAIPRSSWRSHTWPEFSGTSCGPAQVSRTLQTESAGLHGVGQQQWAATRREQRGGRRARQLRERQIFCR